MNEKRKVSINIPENECEELFKEAYDKGYSLNTYLLILIRIGRINL